MDTLRAAVGNVVTDPARAKEVTAAVDDMVTREQWAAAHRHPQ